VRRLLLPVSRRQFLLLLGVGRVLGRPVAGELAVVVAGLVGVVGPQEGPQGRRHRLAAAGRVGGRRRLDEAQLLLQVLLLGPLAQGLLPVLAALGVDVGQRRRVGLQLELVRRGVLHRVDRLDARPEPAVRHRGDVEARGQEPGDHHRLVEPRREQPVEQHLAAGAVDPVPAVVDHVVQAARRVVVAGAVAQADVERDVQAAADLADQEPHEHLVGRRRLLGPELAQLGPGRQRGQHAPLDRQRLERRRILGAAVGRRLALEHAREVGGRLRGRQHRLGEAPQLGEQLDGRRDLRDAADLPRAVLPEPVQHLAGRHPVVLQRVERLEEQVPGVRLQDVVDRRVAALVQFDAVDPGVGGEPQGRRRHLVRLDHLDVELGGPAQAVVVDEQAEALAVADLAEAEQVQLLGQADRRRPLRPGLLDLAVGVRVGRPQLQPRAGADQVVGEGQGDAAGVGVVGDLVPRPAAEDRADLVGVGRPRRQDVGLGPQAGVLVGRLGRVVAGLDAAAVAEEVGAAVAPPGRRRLRSRQEAADPVEHQDPRFEVPVGPGWISFVKRMPRPFLAAPALAALCLSSAMRSVRGCADTEPASPETEDGPAATESRVSSRSATQRTCDQVTTGCHYNCALEAWGGEAIRVAWRERLLHIAIYLVRGWTRSLVASRRPQSRQTR
jgi:hypothetical protein